MNTRTKAEELFKAEDFKSALVEFTKVIDEDPDDAIAYQRIAQCNDRLGNEDDAMKAAKKALEINPMLSIPYTILAFVYHRNNRDDKSLAGALTAYNLAPKSIDSLHCYGTILAAQGRLEEGIRLLEEARGLDPNRFSVRNNLAIAYIWAGNHSKYWEEANFLFAQRPSVKYGRMFLDAFQRKYAFILTVLAILAVFGALLLKLRLLLLFPTIPAVKGLLYSYQLLKQGKLRTALTYFIANMLYAVFLVFIFFQI